MYLDDKFDEAQNEISLLYSDYFLKTQNFESPSELDPESERKQYFTCLEESLGVVSLN